MGISQGFEGLRTTHAWLLDTISSEDGDTGEPADFRIDSDSSWLAQELTQEQIGTARVLGLQSAEGSKPVRAELHARLTMARPGKVDRFVALAGRDSVAWRRVDELVTCVEDPEHDHDALALWSTLFAIYDRFAAARPLRGALEDLEIGVEQVDYYVTCEKGRIPKGMGERVRLATTLATASAGPYAPKVRLFLWNPDTDSVVGPLGTTGTATSDIGAWAAYLGGAGASPLPTVLADWLRDSHVGERIGWRVGFTGPVSLRGPSWSLASTPSGFMWDGTEPVTPEEAHRRAKADDDATTEELQSLSSKQGASRSARGSTTCETYSGSCPGTTLSGQKATRTTRLPTCARMIAGGESSNSASGCRLAAGFWTSAASRSPPTAPRHRPSASTWKSRPRN